LVEPRLDRAVGGQPVVLLPRFTIPEPVEEQLVPEALRLVLEGRRQAYGYVISKRSSAGLFGEAAALKRPILEEAARRNQLGALNS
jgi:hypothetical protein